MLILRCLMLQTHARFLFAQVFFRLMHHDQHALREHIVSDLWVLFDGVKDTLGVKELASFSSGTKLWQR